jgi:hypothetical protein
MTTKHLTAPEALREIARQLGNAQKGDWIHSFPYLCNRTTALRREGRITDEVSARITDRIQLHTGGASFFSAAYREGECEGDDVGPRILAALWLAHELEDDG